VKNTREMLRHAVATVAYRGGKTVRDAPLAFAEFRAGPTSRTAAEILSHMGDLFDWALTQAKGVEAWHQSATAAWDPTADRFFRSLADFDAYLASDQPIKCSELCEGRHRRRARRARTGGSPPRVRLNNDPCKTRRQFDENVFLPAQRSPATAS
jgi:hypothetical protein